MTTTGRVLAIVWMLAMVSAGAASPIAEQWQGLALDRGKTRTELNLPPEGYRSVFVDLPANVTEMRLRTGSPGGNVDLLVRRATPHQGTTVQELVDESDFVAATSSGNESLTINGSSEPKLTPGRWWVTVLNRKGLNLTVGLDIEIDVEGDPFVIDAGVSGTWYEPERTYQGFFFEMIGADEALVVWFTYEPDGAQAYLIGNGHVGGDQVTITELIRTSGGVYGAAFDPAAIVREDWGDLNFTFTSCDSAIASYVPSVRATVEGWVPDQLELERLTSVQGISCGNDGGAPAKGGLAKDLRGGISGAWYRPERSGEGWFIQVLNDHQAYVYFFTYTPNGEQAWIGNVGQILGNTVLVDQALRPTGGLFGPDYDPATVTLNPWGAFALVFTDCGTALGSAIGPPGYGEGSYEGVTRLTALASTDACGFNSDPFATTGTALAPSQNFVDGDVNNPLAPNLDNDTPSQTQEVGNPALISGFAAATATGNPGDRFASEPDIIDAYRLPITAGQTIQLVVSDWNAAAPEQRDLDLFLFAAGDPGTVLQSALGTDKNEFITVTTTGTYDLVVQAIAGRSNYVLSIASAAPFSSTGALSLEAEIEPDQLIMRFDDHPGGKAPAQSAAAWSTEFALLAKGGAAEGPMLFELGTGKARDRALAKAGITSKPMVELGGGYRLSAEQSRRYELLQLIKALRGDTRLRYVENNLRAQAQAVPNDPGYPLQWHYPQINLPQAWDISTGSPNVIAAVIDTGISNHPDLSGKIRADLGVDLIGNLFSACDGNAADFDATDPGDGRGCGDVRTSSFHGTHVGGTIAAATNNGNGVAGISWGSTLMPVRVLGRGGSGSSFDIADGIRWAGGAGARGAVPARGADVINLSLGGTGACPAVYQEAINSARGRGAVIVVAAGNNNSSGEFTPANCPGVINVAALDRGNRPAVYSNCHPSVMVAAPGGETASEFSGSDLFAPNNPTPCKPFSGGTATAEDGVLSTLGPGTMEPAVFAYYQGTSMATPHVAGVIALMKSAHPAMTPAEVDQLLASGRITIDVAGDGATTRDPQTGFGMIDAHSAVREAKLLAGGATTPPVVIAQPASLVFGETTTQLTFNLSGQGTGENVITGVGTAAPWLNLSGGGENGFGDYFAIVDRTGLVEGNYSALIGVNSSMAGSLTLNVSLRVGPMQTSGSLGFIYVLLLDPVTGVVLAQTQTTELDGAYPFTFSNLRAGRYLVVAGSDNDNDGNLCDPGEACGFYPDFENFAAVDLAPGVALPSFLVPADGAGIGQTSAAAATLNERRVRSYRR